ncbi:MAG: hypothetical protein WCR27_07860 [Eubacteriales bacterium]
MGLKRLKKIKIALIIIIALLLGWFMLVGTSVYYQVRSYVVMYFYSLYEENHSLLSEKNISIEIPGGVSTEEKDWYPFVMAFDDSQGFSRYVGKNLSLTILYNFGAFKWNEKMSSIFNPDSPYYTSFYGAYLVRQDESLGEYGFESGGKIDVGEVFAVPEYDFKYLVLQSIGCVNPVLKIEDYEVRENVKYLGYEGWTRIDADLETSGTAHKYSQDCLAYIQYGKPEYFSEQDFSTVKMKGRIYAKYIEEYGCTIYFYIFMPEKNDLEKCDREILSKTKIDL